jgi:hypothetical protein
VRFGANDLTEISLDLTTHIPDLRERPLTLEFILNGETLTIFQLFRNGWLHLDIFVPEAMAMKSSRFELEVRADRTWQPRPDDNGNRDDRELSIAVCNLEVKSGTDLSL